MQGNSITSRISKLLGEISYYKEDNPRFALLCCRTVAEAILMGKHIEKVEKGDIKNIITLGDIHSKAFGFDKEFNDLQKSSFEFINRSTSLFLHFNYDEPEIPHNLVERVLGELKYLLPITEEQLVNVVISGLSIESAKEKDITGWKEMLELELGNWDFRNRRIVTKKRLKLLQGTYEKGAQMSKNPEKSNAHLYKSGITKLLKLSDSELLLREKALLRSILIIFYQRHGGPNYNKKIDTISGKDLRSAMLDSHCICGPHPIRGSFLKHGSKHKAGSLTLIDDWNFMKLQ
tara:strand:+ start:860 stop:1729 length:870 start_codon:yes stop_codon:yes gene_type:complete